MCNWMGAVKGRANGGLTLKFGKSNLEICSASNFAFNCHKQ